MQICWRAVFIGIETLRERGKASGIFARIGLQSSVFDYGYGYALTGRSPSFDLTRRLRLHAPTRRPDRSLCGLRPDKTPRQDALTKCRDKTPVQVAFRFHLHPRASPGQTPRKGRGSVETERAKPSSGQDVRLKASPKEGAAIDAPSLGDAFTGLQDFSNWIIDSSASFTLGWVAAMAAKRTILIIDDNDEIIAALNDYLFKNGYLVVSASNGLEGLKRLEMEGGRVDLIITDLVMPHISGVGVISIAKKKYPHIPVIAITGWGEYPENLAAEAKADVVIEKPFELGYLDQWLHKLLPGEA